MLKINPNLHFEGIGGIQMQSLGCDSLYEMEKLSVMGLVEVLQHLPELFRIRSHLIEHWIQNPPDVFIGIDAPDFNLPLETKLKQAGIKTVHYVSPTLWAWREGRHKKLKAATTLVLAIFPFEQQYLQQFKINARYIGHPLADQIAFQKETTESRLTLKIDPHKMTLAILAGSRMGELKRHAALFIQSAALLQKQYPDLQCISNFATDKTKAYFMQQWALVAPDLKIHCYQHQTETVLGACDIAIVASGTVTLEGLLVGRLMVVGYRLSPLTYWIIRGFKLFKLPYFSMVNILAERKIVPELLQADCQAQKISQAAQTLLKAESQTLLERYQDIRQQLKCNASQQGAKAVFDLLDDKSLPDL